MRSNVDVAREIVISYFESLASKDRLNIAGFQEVAAIAFDETNERLLEHIKALRNIFDDAIQEIESGNNGTQ